MSRWQVRAATLDDLDAIAEFNVRLAAETESVRLDRDRIRAGVAALLTDPSKGRYLVATGDDDGPLVGQMMHTFEWSDWRNGWIWWLQSVYVAAAHRRQGVFRDLFERLRLEAEARPDVVGIRLYVEQGNADAQRTYRSLGLVPAGYAVMQRLFRAELELDPDPDADSMETLR